MRNRDKQVSDVINSETAPEAVVTETTETGTSPDGVGNGAAPKSIRQLIMGSILAGKPTKEIAEAVKAAFPNSQAAAKSTKHIAWYRSRMKKDGQLKAPVVDVASAS